MTPTRRPGALLCWVALAIGTLQGCGGSGSGSDANPLAVLPTPAPPASPVPPAPPAPGGPPGVPAGHVLVWSDEFDTPGLPDTTHWDHDTDRNRAGWYNNERQYYARDRAENARVLGGQLHITARREDLSGASDWGGQHYTSARLVTRGKAEWTYGFFEMRAKLPCGQGTWPAIWTLGSSGSWPDAGELDIMEQVGSNPRQVLSTVHTQQSGGSGTGATVQVADACTAFHNYQMTWTAEAIEFAVDGVSHYRYANPKTGTRTWPFNAPQYLLLNLAIGGDLGGAIDDRIFPVVMVIEHVRVYQLPK